MSTTQPHPQSNTEATTHDHPVTDLLGGRALGDVVAEALAGLAAPEAEVDALRQTVETRCSMTLASLVESAGYRIEGARVRPARVAPRPWGRVMDAVSSGLHPDGIARAVWIERQDQAREQVLAQQARARYGAIDERPIIDERALEHPASRAELEARTHLPDGVTFDIDPGSAEQWPASRSETKTTTYRVGTTDTAAAQSAIDEAEAIAARAELLVAMLSKISGGGYDSRWALAGPSSYDRRQRIVLGWWDFVLHADADGLDAELLQDCSRITAKDHGIQERYWVGTQEDYAIRTALVSHARHLARSGARLGLSGLL